jgi:8-oxo-dGTP diphosphatase
VEVAVAVLVRPDGRVLLGQRPREKVYAGFWEFPGGKVERGEAVFAALEREVREELGVVVVRAFPWIVRRFVYPHATVNLNFFRVVAWLGEPHAVEHQALSWQDPACIDVAPLLPANGPVLRALQLPAEYAITRAREIGIAEFLERIKSRLGSGLRLIQVREKELDRDELGVFAEKVIALARPFGARVMINTDIALAHMLGADGVHLNSRQLSEASERPDLPLCAASCHRGEDLRRAEALGIDFAVLGPVDPTPSHPGAETLGWKGFQRAVANTEIPVYAIGGVSPDALDNARACGAHGIAMVRGSWQL